MSRIIPLATSIVAAGVLLASPVIVRPVELTTSGPLRPYSGSTLDTPDRDAFARMDVRMDTSGRTHVHLVVTGLDPDHAYGGHVHLGECDPSRPHVAGPRVQRVPNPEPEDYPHDPAFVNPGNEIWLDTTTDPFGSGSVDTTMEWQLSPHRVPASVIIHEHPTAPGPVRAGWAGDPLACMEVTL